MADWLGNHLFGQPLELRSQKNWNKGDAVLNYSDELIDGSYQIRPHGLLFQNSVADQNPQVEVIDGLPVFFQTPGDHPFDILSASFYLISRYEEYLPHEKDMYGRYAHEHSLAFRSGFLKRPLVDEWVLDLKSKLKIKFPELVFSEKSFRYLPTYDLDMAWSYREKGFWRTVGGIIKQALTGKRKELTERRKVLAGKAKDPFDVFDDLDELHKMHKLRPLYFFLLAAKQKGYDKNISPNNMEFRSLVHQLSRQYENGIHLSWQASQNPGLMSSEKKELEAISSREVFRNRMHYIMFHLPTTFRLLIDIGITEDHSMGYGSINGFRASTSHPYYWYDLEKESATTLKLFPFCYMEANSIFEQKDDPHEAISEMRHYASIVKKVDGTFVSIFHNHLVRYDEQGWDWWEVLDALLEIVDG